MSGTGEDRLWYIGELWQVVANNNKLALKGASTGSFDLLFKFGTHLPDFQLAV